MKKYQFASIILFCLVCLGFTMNAQTGTTVVPAGLDSLINEFGETPENVTNTTSVVLGQIIEFECADSATYKAVLDWARRTKASAGYGKATSTDLSEVTHLLVLRDFKSPTQGTVGVQTLVVYKSGKAKFVQGDDLADSWKAYAACNQPSQCTVKCDGKLGDDKSATAPLATAATAAKMPWQRK